MQYLPILNKQYYVAHTGGEEKGEGEGRMVREREREREEDKRGRETVLLHVGCNYED